MNDRVDESREHADRRADAALRRAAVVYSVTIVMMVASVFVLIYSIQLAHRGGLVGGAQRLLASIAPEPEAAAGSQQAQTGGASEGEPAAEPALVIEVGGDITGLKFVPEHATVRVGQTVLWRNVSFDIHTVTADPALAADAEHVRLPEGAEPFDSGRFRPDETFSYTFNTPGLFRYFCIPHEATGMTGEITVEE